MCSLAGLCADAPPAPHDDQVAAVLGMLRATRHRGPDGCGVYADGFLGHGDDEERVRAAVPDAKRRAPVVLGQSRLAITGSAASRQPFVSDDGSLALAHNGEIYNHRELRALLGPDAGLAGDASDSEVLMRVLERHRARCPLEEAVRRTVLAASGMYALAVTDGETVVLARDAVGKKPLYTVEGNGLFAWASERKALRDAARAAGAPIVPLAPGRMLVKRKGTPARGVLVERLSPPAVDIMDMEAALDEYGRALENAIARRVRGLRNAAVLFSGGVDSVLVARMLQRAGVAVTGYVAGAKDSRDVEHARRVAQDLELPFRVTEVDEATLAADLPTILRHAELNGPLMAEVSVPMWYASKAAHEDGHRVIFTGQAADELFAGYDWYGRVLAEGGPLELQAKLWEDLLRLPQDTLEREDRLTMAWSLELRAPFLDTEVVRAAFRIAPTLKLESAEDPHRKRPHRILAQRLGVPHRHAFRRKDAAQDGSSVRGLLERVARLRFPDGVEGPAPPVPDFGSNYRYRDRPGRYATPEVYALLDALPREGRFLVARQDGTATPDPEPALVARGSESPR